MENIQTVPSAPARLPTVNELLSSAWRFYHAHLAMFIGIAVIPVLLKLTDLISPFFIASGGIQISLTIVSFLAIMIMQYTIIDTVVENGEPVGGVGGAYRKALRFFLPAMWVGFLVGISTFGGMMLLVIPGINVSIWLSFALIVLFAEGRRGMSALTGSWHYAHGFGLQIFWRLLASGIIVALPLIIFSLVAVALGVFDKPFPAEPSSLIGTQGSPIQILYGVFALLYQYLVILPFGLAYVYFLYRALRNIKGEMTQASDEEHAIKKKLTALSILGVVGIILFVIFFVAIFALLFGKFLDTDVMKQPSVSMSPASSYLTATGLTPFTQLLGW